MAQAEQEGSRKRPALKFTLGAREAVFEFLEPETVLGSSPDADLSLSARGVADRHVRFEWDGEVCLLTSLIAAQPVEVNGSPRREWMLRDGDELRVGALAMRFLWNPPSQPTPSAPAAPPAGRTASAPALVPRASATSSSTRTRRPAPYQLNSEECCRRSTGVRRLGIIAAVALAILIGGLSLRALTRAGAEGEARSRTPARSGEGEDRGSPSAALDPFVQKVIRPIGERIERHPEGARLILRRCRYFLEKHPHGPSADCARRILKRAQDIVGPGESWTWKEVDYATRRPAPPDAAARNPGYFQREKEEILRSFLKTSHDARKRFAAKRRLEDLLEMDGGARRP